MNDKIGTPPDHYDTVPSLSEKEARLQRRKNAQELFDQRCREAADTGGAIVDIPPELLEGDDEDEHVG